RRGLSGGQMKVGACRDRRAAARAARLERLFAAEHVPDGDQDLARHRGLCWVGRAGALLDVAVLPDSALRARQTTDVEAVQADELTRPGRLDVSLGLWQGGSALVAGGVASDQR